MKNLLSENMLRFGTKNLSESAKKELVVKAIMETINQHGLSNVIKKRLAEQMAPGQEPTKLGPKSISNISLAGQEYDMYGGYPKRILRGAAAATIKAEFVQGKWIIWLTAPTGTNNSNVTYFTEVRKTSDGGSGGKSTWEWASNQGFTLRSPNSNLEVKLEDGRVMDLPALSRQGLDASKFVNEDLPKLGITLT